LIPTTTGTAPRLENANSDFVVCANVVSAFSPDDAVTLESSGALVAGSGDPSTRDGSGTVTDGTATLSMDPTRWGCVGFGDGNSQGVRPTITALSRSARRNLLSITVLGRIRLH